ncbi:MAG: hypothetical protein EPN68_11750 [Rhodanobacter sp.]|nr:MAG: hypothetical protein EPN68_11750 [Rhodanobacter sp.]
MSTMAAKLPIRHPAHHPETGVLARVPSGNPLQRRVNGSPRQQQQHLQMLRLRSDDPIGPVPAQRKKDEEQRGEKHSRVQHAKATIAKLGGSLKPGLYGHIFDARPVGGGDLDPAAPSGLHAYTHGALPGTVVAVGRQGSAGGIHSLRWRAAGGGATKDSTMFPTWMPAVHVCTLIALKYPAARGSDVEGPLYAEDTKTYIQHGQDIYSRITKSGDTVYPQ